MAGFPSPAPALRFTTPGIHGQAVAFSPYAAAVRPQPQLAVVGAQHYGIAGCGELHVLQSGPAGLVESHRLEWSDGLFDLTWSEQHENHIMTASGDGSLQLWDLGVLDRVRGPIRHYTGHKKECVSVQWSQTRGESLVLSGSWDGSVNLWDPQSPGGALNVSVPGLYLVPRPTLPAQPRPVSSPLTRIPGPITVQSSFSEHLAMVYGVSWSPRKPGVFASVSGDTTLKVWDARRAPGSVQTFKAHNHEVLTCDWSKYNENLVVTGSVDKTIRGFDVRAGPGSSPVFVLEGHTYAVRKVKCSPFHATEVASCSYDFTTRIWDFATPQGGPQLKAVFDDHTEFVIGLDYNLGVRGQLADCSWDETVAVRTMRV